jgi:mRNA interferase HicA
MKRRELIQLLIKAGCTLKRSSGPHDMYFNPQTGKSAPIPRHTEIKKTLVELIKKQLGV